MKNTEWAVAIFKDFAIRSLDLQGRFQFGASDEMNSEMETYPYMYVQANEIRVSPNEGGKSGYASMETTFEITIADKNLSSFDNELQTVSDSQEIMLALIAELTTHPYYVANQMKMVGDAIITTSYEADDAILSKVTADITLRYPFRYQYCNQPVEDIPFYPTITTDIFTSVTQSLCTIIDQCPVIINIQNDIIDLQEQINEFIFSTKTLISGGAEWSGVGLTFSVSELEYTFTGPILFAGPEEIGLNVGDPTYSRVDAIVVNEAGDISVIEGIPSPDPATPPIPDEELLVQFIIVGAGATTPSITQEFVYVDNNEWATSTYQTSGLIFGSVSFTATTPSPFQGAFCINSNTDQRTGLRFQRVSNFDATQYAVLSLRVWFDAAIPTNRSLQIQLWNNTNPVGGVANLMTLGLNRNTIGQWQQILVPITVFGGVTNVNRMQIRMVGGTNNQTVQFALDFIQFQTGVVQPTPQNNITVQKAGTSIAARSKINFIDGINASITVQDDVLNDRVNITIGSSGGGGSGVTGATGPVGPTGAAGQAGPTGEKGETGSIGPVGPTGEKGETGSIGPIGPTGAAGQAGPTGEKGETGAIGPIGTIGPTGAAGQAGPTGEKGETGSVGATGPAGQAGSTGPAGPIGPTGLGGALGAFGSFYSNIDQPLLSTTQSQAVTINATYSANQVSITSGSRITFATKGTYQLTYVAQISNLANSIEDAIFWIRYNGSDYPNSGTQVSLQPRKGPTTPSKQLVTVSFIGVAQNDGDYIELVWVGTSLSLSLQEEAANFIDGSAEVPSVIVNISQVMYNQLGPTGVQGPTGTVPSGVYLPLAGSTPSSLMQGPIEAKESIGFDIFQRDTPNDRATLIRMNAANQFYLFAGNAVRTTGACLSISPDFIDICGQSHITNNPPTFRIEKGNIEMTGGLNDQLIFSGDITGQKSGAWFKGATKTVQSGSEVVIFQSPSSTCFNNLSVTDGIIKMGQGDSYTASNTFIFDLVNQTLILGSSSQNTTNGAYNLISGFGNVIDNTPQSSIIGGYKNNIKNKSKSSSIIGGENNLICSSREGSIIGSKTAEIYLSYYSSVISSYKACAYNKTSGSILGGVFKSQITRSKNSGIIGAKSSAISYAYGSVILGGAGQQLNCSNYSAIIAAPNSSTYKGYNGVIAGGDTHNNNGYNSVILGGSSNGVGSLQYRGAVIAGQSNQISPNYGYSCNSVVIGGYGNSIRGACNSVIIGGQNVALYSSDIVQVPMLRTTNLTLDNASTNIAVFNSTANDLHYRELCSILNGTSGTFSIGGATFSICDGLILNIIQ
jgi:hypothetical protein